MNPLLEKLHDIDGLDFISRWPLASGWWALIGIIILLFSGLSGLLIRQIIFRRSWKNDTLKKLSFLEKNLTDHTARESVMQLSEYLRRIALKKYSRKECAGLINHQWLKWLADHDPKKFDWEKKGKILIEVPYAPSNYFVSALHVKELIKAVREWVH